MDLRFVDDSVVRGMFVFEFNFLLVGSGCDGEDFDEPGVVLGEIGNVELPFLVGMLKVEGSFNFERHLENSACPSRPKIV